MAQEHDLFDDIIEISKGFDFLKNPLGGVTDALDPSAPQWNPADYKERPRGNTIPCLTCKNEKSGCTACMDVCPVNAIEVEEDAIEILDSCRKCGLCAAACPTEAIISPRLAPKNLYDDIVSAATSHETAYVPARAPSSACRARTRSSSPAWAILRPRLGSRYWPTIPT
jgi:4Fe-4S binding domain